MTATVKKRIDHLYEGELRRWREAWIAFWTDVWRPITDHELELASTVPRDDEDKERWPEVQAVVIEDCTAWEPDEAEAWVQWAHAMDAFLERCPDEEFLQHTYEMVPSSADSIRRTLAVWPRQFPVPPEEEPGAWDTLKKKVLSHQEAEEGLAVLEAGIAAHLVCYLSIARAVRIRLTTWVN